MPIILYFQLLKQNDWFAALLCFKLNIFVGRTKQNIQRRHIGLWEILSGIF